MHNLFSNRQRRSDHQMPRRFRIANAVFTSALQNAVLTDTTTKEPWTEFASLPKVATSFANEMQAKQSHVNAHVDNAGRSRRGEFKQRSQQKAKPGRDQAPASAEKREARNRTSWCRDEQLRDNCLPSGHIRASCPNTATPEQRQQALQAYATWKRWHKNKGSKPPFRK